MTARPIILGVVLVGIAGLDLSDRRRQNERIEQLETQLADIQRLVRRAPPATPTRAVERIIEKMIVAGPAAPVGPEAAPAPPTVPKDADSIGAEVETSFQKEALDPAWAGRARDSIHRGLSDATSDMARRPAIRAVDCRASLCRIELLHESAEEQQTLAERISAEGPGQFWKGASFTAPPETSPDGRVVTVMFLAREGHAIPYPDDR